MAVGAMDGGGAAEVEATGAGAGLVSAGAVLAEIERACRAGDSAGCQGALTALRGVVAREARAAELLPRAHHFVVVSFARSDDIVGMGNALREMGAAGVPPLKETFASVARAYARRLDMRRAYTTVVRAGSLEAPGDMKRPAFATATWNALLRQLLQMRQFRRAADTWNPMCEAGVPHDVTTLGMMVYAFSECLDVPQSMRMLGLLQQVQERPPIWVYNIVIKMHSATRSAIGCKGVLDELLGRGVQPTVETYNLVLGALAEDRGSESTMTATEVYMRMMNVRGLLASVAHDVDDIVPNVTTGRIAEEADVALPDFETHAHCARVFMNYGDADGAFKHYSWMASALAEAVGAPAASTSSEEGAGAGARPRQGEGAATDGRILEQLGDREVPPLRRMLAAANTVGHVLWGSAAAGMVPELQAVVKDISYFGILPELQYVAGALEYLEGHMVDGIHASWKEPRDNFREEREAALRAEGITVQAEDFTGAPVRRPWWTYENRDWSEEARKLDKESRRDERRRAMARKKRVPPAKVRSVTTWPTYLPILGSDEDEVTPAGMVYSIEDAVESKLLKIKEMNEMTRWAATARRERAAAAGAAGGSGGSPFPEKAKAISQMSISELRKELGMLGLPINGTKQFLYASLKQARAGGSSGFASGGSEEAIAAAQASTIDWEDVNFEKFSENMEGNYRPDGPLDKDYFFSHVGKREMDVSAPHMFAGMLRLAGEWYDGCEEYDALIARYEEVGGSPRKWFGKKERIAVSRRALALDAAREVRAFLDDECLGERWEAYSTHWASSPMEGMDLGRVMRERALYGGKGLDQSSSSSGMDAVKRDLADNRLSLSLLPH